MNHPYTMKMYQELNNFIYVSSDLKKKVCITDEFNT